MTLHPGVYRNHHEPTHQRFGADVGCDIPVAMEFTRGLQPLLERYGTATGFHLVLFTLDETVFSREIAPAGRLLPERLRGRAVVVPRRPRRDPPLPRRGHRDRRVRPHLGLHRRHPGVLLHPGPPRHVAPAGLRLPGRAGRHPPPRRGRGPGHGARPRDRQPEDGVQAVTRTAAQAEPRARRPPGRPGPDRPPRARQLLPRPPGLVHRARPGRRGLGHRRLRRAPRRRRPRAGRPGRALHAARARRRRRPPRGRLGGRRGLRPSWTTGGAVSPAPSWPWSPPPSPRPATGAPPTAASTGRIPRSRPTSPRCATHGTDAEVVTAPGKLVLGLAVAARPRPARAGRGALRQRPGQRGDGRARGRRAGRGRRPRPRRLDRRSTSRS